MILADAFFESKVFYHDLIESIVAALEAKDTYTANHSRRVSDLVEQLCIVLNVPDLESQLIHMAAHVHDIGKIGIPDSILLKPTQLSAEEWEQMKTHSQVGATILKKSASLHDVATIVLHHHERWDGNGYPYGLSMNTIPFGSRLIAVCDSVDAMLSIRAYRKPLTFEQCKLEIYKNIGVMYDPHLAQTLLYYWDEVLSNIHY